MPALCLRDAADLIENQAATIAKMRETNVSLTELDHLESPAQQCRKLGIKVGDTIEGTEAGVGWWNTTRLTLLWIGETECVWRMVSKTDKRPQWSEPCEAVKWTLSCREWHKVDERQR